MGDCNPWACQTKVARVKNIVPSTPLIDGGTGRECGVVAVPFPPLLAATPVELAANALPAAQIFPCTNGDAVVLWAYQIPADGMILAANNVAGQRSGVAHGMPCTMLLRRLATAVAWTPVGGGGHQPHLLRQLLCPLQWRWSGGTSTFLFHPLGTLRFPSHLLGMTCFPFQMQKFPSLQQSSPPNLSRLVMNMWSVGGDHNATVATCLSLNLCMHASMLGLPEEPE